MLSVSEELKKLEKRKIDLEKLVEFENDMLNKEKEYQKAKEKYESAILKIDNAKTKENKQ